MNSEYNIGTDPRTCTGMSQYEQAINLSGCLYVPKNMHPAELEWEYFVSKLHWNYLHSTPEDLVKIKEIASRIS